MYAATSARGRLGATLVTRNPRPPQAALAAMSMTPAVTRLPIECASILAALDRVACGAQTDADSHRRRWHRDPGHLVVRLRTRARELFQTRAALAHGRYRRADSSRDRGSAQAGVAGCDDGRRTVSLGDDGPH